MDTLLETGAISTLGLDKSKVSIKIGVLGLQGDYQMHCNMLNLIEGVDAEIVKLPADIEKCQGLVIPGGESTTVGKLMDRYGVDKAIIGRVKQGMPIFGTCTGMILLATEIEGSDQHRLGLIDMTIKRNAFGRQVDSFEADINIAEIGGDPIKAVFIRAPLVTKAGPNVKVMATLEDGEIIMVRQDNCLAAAFHPELTDDNRVHKYFVDMARDFTNK